MAWKRVINIDQIEQLSEYDIILRYTAPGVIPEELTGSSYAENYQVTSVENDRLGLRLTPARDDIQQMLNSVFPTSVTKQNIINEGNWFVSDDGNSATFIDQ